MKFIGDRQDLHLYNCYEDEKRIIGIYPVMFGYRIRAGWKGNQWVETDWCAGADHDKVYRALAFQLAILRKYDDFEKIPANSLIKPFHNDIEFIKEIGSLINNEEFEDALIDVKKHEQPLFTYKQKMLDSLWI